MIRGQSNDRRASRAWPLIALIVVAALATNSSFKIRIETADSSPRRPLAAAPDREPPPQPPALIELPWLPVSSPSGEAAADPGTPSLLAIPAAKALDVVPPPAPTAAPPASILDPKVARTALILDPPPVEVKPAPVATAETVAPRAPSVEVAPPPPPDPPPAPSATAVDVPAPPAEPPSDAASPPLVDVPPPAPPAPEPAPPAATADQPQGPPADADRLKVPPVDAAAPTRDAAIEPAACATCGGYHAPTGGMGLGDLVSCADGQCIPGRNPCPLPFPESDNVFAGMINNLYQCLCCPDPCYQPQWVPAANASFFADYARPRTVTRLRYDNLENLVRPDRNAFWIGQVQTIRSPHRDITNIRARLQQVYIYQEAAGPRGSFFIEYPYRQINPSYEPTQAGFGDMNFGMKSMFFDCEMLQMTFQFRTYAPTGNSTNGLGTGHFSLDPSVLASLKLGPDTYVQGQYGNWIPLGGNSKVAGGVFYWLTSLNQVLWYLTPDSPLIGTLELDGWSFENGGYTSAILPSGKFSYVEKGGGVSYFNIGPGLRQSICNRMDFGGAITWATSSVHWAQPWFRFEVRFLF